MPLSCGGRSGASGWIDGGGPPAGWVRRTARSVAVDGGYVAADEADADRGGVLVHVGGLDLIRLRKSKAMVCSLDEVWPAGVADLLMAQYCSGNREGSSGPSGVLCPGQVSGFPTLGGASRDQRPSIHRCGLRLRPLSVREHGRHAAIDRHRPPRGYQPRRAGQVTDRQTLYDILDAGLVAHVGLVRDGMPVDPAPRLRPRWR